MRLRPYKFKAVPCVVDCVLVQVSAPERHKGLSHAYTHPPDEIPPCKHPVLTPGDCARGYQVVSGARAWVAGG